MSFGSGTVVPPVNGHGQDGRASANDTTTGARNGWTVSGFAPFVLLATPHSSLATAFETSDSLSDHQRTATHKFVGCRPEHGATSQKHGWPFIGNMTAPVQRPSRG